jgi:hypothetical protein
LQSCTAVLPWSHRTKPSFTHICLSNKRNLESKELKNKVKFQRGKKGGGASNSVVSKYKTGIDLTLCIHGTMHC